MDVTTSASNQSSGDRPEVIAAIVLGCLFGVLLVLASLIAFIFIMKYRNRKRSEGEQGDASRDERQHDVRNKIPDHSTADHSSVNQTVLDYPGMNAVPNHECHKVMCSTKLSESNTKPNGNIGDRQASSQTEHPTSQFEEHFQDPSHLPSTIENSSRKYFWQKRQDRKLANSEKIGRSRKRYIERLFRRMTKVPVTTTKTGGNDTVEYATKDHSTDVRGFRNSIIKEDQSSGDIQKSPDLKHLDETVAVLPEEEDSQIQYSGAVGDDYINKMLEQWRKEEMEKEPDEIVMERRFSHKVHVDAEMIKFQEINMKRQAGILSGDTSNH